MFGCESSFAAFVGASFFGESDAFSLAFTDEGAFEFGEGSHDGEGGTAPGCNPSLSDPIFLLPVGFPAYQAADAGQWRVFARRLPYGAEKLGEYLWFEIDEDDGSFASICTNPTGPWPEDSPAPASSWRLAVDLQSFRTRPGDDGVGGNTGQIIEIMLFYEQDPAGETLVAGASLSL